MNFQRGEEGDERNQDHPFSQGDQGKEHNIRLNNKRTPFNTQRFQQQQPYPHHYGQPSLYPPSFYPIQRPDHHYPYNHHHYAYHHHQTHPPHSYPMNSHQKKRRFNQSNHHLSKSKPPNQDFIQTVIQQVNGVEGYYRKTFTENPWKLEKESVQE